MNAWCDFAHNYQCSFAGVYQPYLPPAPGPFGEFYGFGTFKDVWKMLEMPEVKSNMTVYRERAERLCGMGWKELQDWNEEKKKKNREKKCVACLLYRLVSWEGLGWVGLGWGRVGGWVDVNLSHTHVQHPI